MEVEEGSQRGGPAASTASPPPSGSSSICSETHSAEDDAPPPPVELSARRRRPPIALRGPGARHAAEGAHGDHRRGVRHAPGLPKRGVSLAHAFLPLPL